MSVDHNRERHDEVSIIGLESALTSAIAHADLAGLRSISDQLLVVKRNALQERRRLELQRVAA